MQTEIIGNVSNGFLRRGVRMNTHENIVVVIPLQTALVNHGRRNQGADGTTETIRRMEESQQLVGPGQIANPRIPRSVADADSQADEGKHEHQDGVRRMLRQHQEANRMASTAEETDPSRANLDMKPVVRRRSDYVADKRGEEDEGHNHVGQSIILLQIRDQGTVGSVIGAADDEAPEAGSDPEHVGPGTVPFLQCAGGCGRRRQDMVVWCICDATLGLITTVITPRSKSATGRRRKSRRRLYMSHSIGRCLKRLQLDDLHGGGVRGGHDAGLGGDGGRGKKRSNDSHTGLQ
jgi:hypothetical protein